MKHYMKHQIYFDTDKPVTPPEREVELNWSELYHGAHKEMPPDMPIPKGKPVYMTTMFDANHAHDLDNHYSVSGIQLFLNNTSIQSHSKRQGTVESSTYVSELVACRKTDK